METATRCSSSCIDTLTSMRCETPHIWQDLSSTGSSLTDLCSGLWMLTAVAEQVPISCGALQPVGWLTGCGARLSVCPHYSGLKQKKNVRVDLRLFLCIETNPPNPQSLFSKGFETKKWTKQYLLRSRFRLNEMSALCLQNSLVILGIYCCFHKKINNPTACLKLISSSWHF